MCDCIYIYFHILVHTVYRHPHTCLHRQRSCLEEWKRTVKPGHRIQELKLYSWKVLTFCDCNPRLLLQQSILNNVFLPPLLILMKGQSREPQSRGGTTVFTPCHMSDSPEGGTAEATAQLLKLSQPVFY